MQKKSIKAGYPAEFLTKTGLVALRVFATGLVAAESRQTLDAPLHRAPCTDMLSFFVCRTYFISLA